MPVCYDPAGMRLLFDVNHPVQVHLLRPLLPHFRARGDEWRVVARDKDVTLGLLAHYGIDCTPTRPGHGRPGLLLELLRRERLVWRLARAFRPRLIVGTSVHAARVARLTGARSVVLNDDDAVANPAFARLAYPLAHAIVTPDCLRAENWGARHHVYAGNQQLFYLHPARFRPDPGVRALVDGTWGFAASPIPFEREFGRKVARIVGVRGMRRDGRTTGTLTGALTSTVAAGSSSPDSTSSRSRRTPCLPSAKSSTTASSGSRSRRRRPRRVRRPSGSN